MPEKIPVDDRMSPYNWFLLAIRVFEGCDCCVNNGTLVPDLGWTILQDGSNATCCNGKLLVETLSNCKIEALTYQLDVSGLCFHNLTI